MSLTGEQIRDAVGDQAAEWFVRNREGALDRDARTAFISWLKASPVHVEEYLAVAALSRDLGAASEAPDLEVDILLARAHDDGDNVVALGRSAPSPSSGLGAPHAPLARRPARHRAAGHRQRRVAAVAAALVVAVGALLWWRNEPAPQPQRYATRHGEQGTWRLADDSVLHLNTDSAVTVRFGRDTRLIQVDRGQALFEVAHEPARRFLVRAGSTSVVATGTQFDVFVSGATTVVTVVEGRVAVTAREPRASAAGASQRVVEVSAGERVRVTSDAFDGLPERTDLERSVAWLRRQIIFEHEPLAAVAAEFNRYGSTPIEVESPALRALAISGTFAADDPGSFVSFLRTLDGVTVEVTPTRIRVLAVPPAEAGTHRGAE